MKKLTAILLAVLMLVSALASCGGNNETTTTASTTETTTTTTTTITTTTTTENSSTDNNDNSDNEENPLDSINWDSINWDSIIQSKVSVGFYDSYFNMKNVLYTDYIYLDKSDKVPSKAKININGENITLDYYESYYDINKGSVITCYEKRIEGGSTYKARFYEDGTIQWLSYYPGFPIEIPENPTQEDIHAVKEFLSQYTDISQYNWCEFTDNTTLVLANMVNGYITDYIQVSVSSQDRKINSIIINKLPIEITSLNVDKEKADELAIQAGKDTFTVPLAEIIYFDISDLLFAKIFNDKIYLLYDCDVIVKHEFFGVPLETRHGVNILIPYELVKIE